jgi:hypothetical protein
MKDAGEIVKGLAQMLATESCTVRTVERLLREAGLVEVLEAGERLRGNCDMEGFDESVTEWDAAVTRLAGEGTKQ